MSRLYDRILAQGCRYISARDVWNAVVDDDDDGPDYRFVAQEILGRTPSDQEVATMHERIRRSLPDTGGDDVLARSEIEGAVVVSAEEVADYVYMFPSGTDIVGVLDRVVPPFDLTFVEFQKRPNPFSLESWGVLFSAELHTSGDGWTLHGALVGEWKRGHPVGPLVRWQMRLDATGLIVSADDEAWTLVVGEHPGPPGKLLIVKPEIADVPDDQAYNFASRGIDLLSPGLFSISLMHCKNVALRGIDPPDRLSKSHVKKTGNPLTRYHVLEIAPMRRILDSEGEAQTKGLGHALHICRGHFKTFTEDAPLFGRRVGTYWWPAHVRGSSSEGVVEKDYRIRIDGDGVGQSYRHADEEVRVASPDEKPNDPDTTERGLRAHNRTQNLLASAVERAGFSPRSSKSGEPDFDLAWVDDGVVWVAEVKSTTEHTEERQMRLAIGQVIRYRQQLSEKGRAVRALVAVENAPSDESWIDLCGTEGIALVWPEVMAQALCNT
jgi:hypothetical protein